MVDIGPNKVVGKCPEKDCNGALVIFNGPWFGSKPKPIKCSQCGFIPYDDKDGTYYIGW